LGYFAEESERVIVIGAGAAGMVAAQALIRAGLKVDILEKEERIAEPWHRRHPRLHLNSYRSLSTLPGAHYPKGTGAFPSKAAVIDHLESFGVSNALPIEFGVEVLDVAREDGLWVVSTNAGPRRARHVVIATGRDRQPYIPEWQGMKDFPGKIAHSADFGPGRDYAGKRVLVVGAGNSGIDVLNYLSRNSTTTLWLSARGGLAVLPKRLAGLPVHLVSPMLARLPLTFADAVVAATQRLAFGDLTKFGFPKARNGGASRLALQNIAIASDDGAIQAIKQGRIIVVPQVREFSARGVVLADGRVIDPDVVIAATGYRTGLGSIVGKLGVLDERGLPLFNGGESDPSLPGLWFTGMRANIAGCFVSARVLAKAITRRIKSEI
jgi:cation diffusion facilitator CzcD-associated flavoprotein CzcO